MTAYLKAVSEVIEINVPEDGVIAACNAVFALEAGRAAAPPFGGAPFTYTPKWSREHCRQYNGINTDMLIQKINDQAYDALLFQADSFAMGSPGFFAVPQDEQDAIFNAIDARYDTFMTLPNLGNGERNMHLYLPRKAP